MSLTFVLELLFPYSKLCFYHLSIQLQNTNNLPIVFYIKPSCCSYYYYYYS